MIKQQSSSSDYILKTSRDYSIYVCSSRAIPFVGDGLKNGQRQALWLLRNRVEKIKTVALAGLLISENLYLHGDASATESISALAAPYINNVPLVEGIGTFGTRVAPTEWASPRYTYVKRSKASEAFFYVDLPVVPMKDNYDGSVKEPEHFIPLIPSLLLNGISGIAVGWSTDVLPRKFSDLLEATIKVLNGEKIKRIKPGYSYLNVDVRHLEGNTWEVLGKVEILDASTVRVKELPPSLSLSKFKDRLNTMEENDAIRGYIDRSTDKINVEVNFSRGSIKDWDEVKAIDFLKLREKTTERIVVIDWNGSSIKQYESAEDVIYAFVKWRLGFYTKRYQKMLADDQYELKFWEAVKMCFDKEFPKSLGGKMKNKEEVENKVSDLTKSLKLDTKTLDRIVSIPTYRWAADYYKVATDKIKELKGNISNYESILKSPKKLQGIYNDELVALRGIK